MEPRGMWLWGLAFSLRAIPWRAIRDMHVHGPFLFIAKREIF